MELGWVFPGSTSLIFQLDHHQWVGCIAVDPSGNWVVCGGSMAPTFFHLSSPSSATKTATMETRAGATTQAAIFVNDRVSECTYR